MSSDEPFPDRAAIRNVLVRSTNWIGDAVMTTPALGALRASFPGARLTVLANPIVAPLFIPHPAVDEVIVYDRQGRHRGFAGKLRLAVELRRRRFDLAVLLQNAIDAALLAWLARIPRRMGYRTDGRGPLLTHGVPLAEETKRLHHVDYYLTMLGRFGICGGERRLALQTTPAEDAAVADLLGARGIAPGDFLIGINPGASYGSAKRWYPERFAAVADQLAARWGAKVVITGGPGEAAIAAEIAATMQGEAADLVGTTSVRELLALIKRCNFFVTNDSGPMHVAAAFAVPLVAIFGPTDHMTTSPFAERTAVVRAVTPCAPCLKRECPTDHRCMLAVTVEDVVAAAIDLGERPAGGGGAA
ncbi:ADP-heptose--LPS heptosyltransferase [Geotalea uraniireducens]|uniref:lipopolysaccharide heptosyltransferase II n=1 Tax=Geotalea uraniireducens TaxID=351604 RepID=A0ABM8EJI4_9BACT|nr:lipopolysaccharide heptosyltransferase II [Geotalea uraniireducens]BDV42546.1 ADP-heptose--LPS heptosyltransferase [Geotalea uraniireducens]